MKAKLIRVRPDGEGGSVWEIVFVNDNDASADFLMTDIARPSGRYNTKELAIERNGEKPWKYKLMFPVIAWLIKKLELHRYE